MNGITDGVRPMILCSGLYANRLTAQDRAKFNRIRRFMLAIALIELHCHHLLTKLRH